MNWLDLLCDEARFLAFRRTRLSFAVHRRAFLTLGLLFTWLAGIGRYWDHPNAWIWQYAGLGSVVYAFVLAAILWLILAPLRPRNCSYPSLLTFVVMTSPLALLYALPVERWFSADTAVGLNMSFLAVVALWRVQLYAVFVKRVAGLAGWLAWLAILLPLSLIVCALALLNLEHAVFSLMAGIEEVPDPNSGALMITEWLAVIAVFVSPVLLLLYAVAVFVRRKNKGLDPDRD